MSRTISPIEPVPVEEPTLATGLAASPGPHVDGSVDISVVVPITERFDNLGEFYRVHAEVLQRTGRSFEFIFVVDAGFEQALDTLRKLRTSDARVTVLALGGAFGEATALKVALDHAHGDVILTLAAYFQTDPEAITPVLDRLAEGYDLVVSRRFPRLDFWVNRLQNYGFHLLTRRLSGVELHDLTCSLRAMHRTVLREIRLYGDLHRFIPLLAYQRGFRISEVSVRQHPADLTARLHGPGIYLRRLLDILTFVFIFKFSKKPLRFFGLIGTGLSGLGAVITFMLAVERILGGTPLADRPLLVLGVLLLVLGVQIGSIGFLAEMLVFSHARNLKDYTIAKVLDGAAPTSAPRERGIRSRHRHPHPGTITESHSSEPPASSSS